VTPRAFAAILLLFTLFAITGPLVAQENPENTRKVLTRVSPAYPELARRMNIHGIVKVGVVISPNGNVKSANVIGGNPVLVNAAVEAVRKWKYEPASGDTTELVELRFDSH